MDFFEHQDEARRNTTRLVVLFALAVLGIAIAIYAIAVGLFAATDLPRGGSGASAGSGGSRGLWHPELALFAGGATLLVVTLGSLYKIAQLRAGGKVIAEQLGGRPVATNTGDPAERQLQNIVAEMSVASGVPMPAPSYSARASAAWISRSEASPRLALNSSHMLEWPGTKSSATSFCCE